jgi:hypothetical protein
MKIKNLLNTLCYLDYANKPKIKQNVHNNHQSQKNPAVHEARYHSRMAAPRARRSCTQLEHVPRRNVYCLQALARGGVGDNNLGSRTMLTTLVN